jgi:undecaprenyl-diphosphatase
VRDSKQEINKNARTITLGLIAAVLFFLLIIFILWKITDEIVVGKKTAFDFDAFALLSDYKNPFNTWLMTKITFFGSSHFIIPAYFILAAIVFYYKRNRYLALTILALGLLSRLVLLMIKNIFDRARPSDPLIFGVDGFSFPSGHSFSAFTFFGLLCYVIWKTKLASLWKWILSVSFIFFAAIIALTRVYLHVHYASDVIAGFCFSMLWLGIVLWVLEKTEKRQLEIK